MKRIVSILMLLFCSFLLRAGELLWVENKGQWESKILFKAGLNNGAVFIEKNKITFVLHDAQQLGVLKDRIHHHSSNDKHKSHKIHSAFQNDTSFSSHAFSIEFSGANLQSVTTGKQQIQSVYNYFIGSDETKWAANVKGFKAVFIENLYPNIDFRIFGKADNLKYEFILKPSSNYRDIQLLYKGVNQLKLAGEQIIISTSVGQIQDEYPVSYYQDFPTDSKQISTAFQLKNNTVQFQLAPHDSTRTIVLDPVLNFASFTGSSVDNWGFTATYDAAGNAYAGGIVFGTGYPVTLGAFQTNYAGGTFDPNWGVDVSISKFSSDGSSLLYSTYLGGSKQETPHSLIVNANNELIVFGTTSSRDFPTTVTAFDTTFNGGDTVLVDNVLQYHGTDIIVSKFSSDGSALLGSTYFGGTKNDGFNDENGVSGLYHNYSDIFRGEVITDNSDNVYVATSTASNDIPIVNGFQNSYGGGLQDGCLVKFNSDLSQVIWSSYIGGTSADGVYGLQANSVEELYITGGTSSSNFPISGGVQNNYSGSIDGFAAKISNDGSSILSSSFIGTADYDQGYFIQLDSADFVYVYGQTTGNMPISGATYNNPGSGQFIHKYNSDLTSLEVATVVGSGSGGTEIVPSAFLVNTCGNVYIAGWGGLTNQGYSNGSTFGLPISSDAQQTTTDGSDFYLMVLNQDFSGLNYATYFGSNTSGEHVDGGTSRFDKNGIVYQAVCAACGATTAFPTTPGAYAETMNSPNCNLAVFKFDVSKIQATIHPNTDSLVCKGDSIHFSHQSSGGSVFEWVFHDGTTSNQPDVYKSFDTAGVYQVQLIVRDPLTCSEADTTVMQFTVEELHVPQISFTDTTVCPGENIFIDLGDTEEYNLLVNGQITGTFNQSTTLVADTSVNYLLTSTTVQCPDSIGLNVTVKPVPIPTNYTADICENETVGFPIPIHPTYSYSWTPEIPMVSNDTAYFSPTDSLVYELEITTECGLVVQEYNIGVTTITTNISPDSTICNGDSLALFVNGGDSYLWSPAVNGEVNNTTPVFIGDTSTLFLVDVIKNNCVKQDSVRIQVLPARPISNDFTIDICNGEQATLPFQTQDDFTYNWSPSSGFTIVNDSVVFSPTDTLNYVLTITGACGIAEVNYQINTTTIDIVKSPDTTVCRGDVVPLFVGGGDSYNWSPAVNGTQTTGSNVNFTADVTTTFQLAVQKDNCTFNDSIQTTVLAARPVGASYSAPICDYEVASLPFPVQSDFSYLWRPSTGVNVNGNEVTLSPSTSTVYTLIITGECGVDSIKYDVPVTEIIDSAARNYTACIGDVVQLFAGGGDSYVWSPDEELTGATTGTPEFEVKEDEVFTVDIIKGNCMKTRQINLATFNKKPQTANKEYTINFGETQQFPLLNEYNYSWSPSTYLSCADCSNPVSAPEEDMTYYFTYTDENNCSITDSLRINVIFDLYVPNAFTPEGGGVNEVFYAYSHAVKEFQMDVFNRWGEKIFTSNDINVGWDGTYKGRLVQQDVYVWEIHYVKVHTNRVINKVGTVTLVR